MKPYDNEDDVAVMDRNPRPQLDPEMTDDTRDQAEASISAELDGTEEAPSEEQVAEDKQREQESMWIALGAYHQRKAEDRVNQRRPVEDRWLEDLRQYHAQYDPKLLQDIRDAQGSEVFVNITAPKTDGFAARMADMILPTDGENWAMKLTPVPEINESMNDETPATNPDGTPMMAGDGKTPILRKDLARGALKALEARREAMEREIADQLAECNFNAAQRTAIDQCAQLGTLVLKGPTVLGRTRKKWGRITDETGSVMQLIIVEEEKPSIEFCDVWDFFPDMTSPDPNVGEDIYQRHYKTRRELRALARQPGFKKEAISRLLKEDRRPMVTALHLQQLREITGEHQTTNMMSLFELWEYHGPVSSEDLAACGCEMPAEYDPLDVMDAVLWFCDGVVLKAALKPSEADDGLGYHVTWVKKDETSPFGFGIPRLMRNSQSVANASWRMVMDNAGLALAPQIIMALGVVPADGKWNIYPGKIWIAKEGGGALDVRNAMQSIDIPIRLKELLTIFETAVKLADEETSMPIIMQGDRTPAIPETAEGMAMLFNAASVIQRRFVRFYDDRIIKPIITAMNHWNMEFNPKEDIKGDWTVMPLGSSALLEKERQSQSVIQALQLIASPVIAPRVDIHGIIEDAFKVLRLGHRVKDRVKADEDAARAAQAAQQAEAAQGGKGQSGPTPEEMQLKQRELDERAATRASNERMHTERMNVDLEKLSHSTGLSREKLVAQLGIAKMKEDANNQRFNAEIAVKQREGSGI
jgi:hypothetical protein